MSRHQEQFSSYVEMINEAFRNIPSENDNVPLIASMNLGAGGKRLRGVLALLSCEAVSGSCDRALPVAVAFESVHLAALIQDDVIDRSQMRRNEQSIVSKYGTSIAILTSDVFIFEILRQLGRYGNMDISKESLGKVLTTFHESVLSTVRGELMDVELGKKREVRLADYILMVRLKTGMLFSAPAACGAIVGRGTKKQVEMMQNFGEDLGVAFQIIDDLIDILGDPSKTGKPKMNDIRNHRANAVVLHCLQHSDPSPQKQFIANLLGKEQFTDEEVEKAREVFHQSGSIDFARKLASDTAERTKTKLEALPSTPARSKLLAFDRYCWKLSEVRSE